MQQTADGPKKCKGRLVNVVDRRLGQMFRKKLEDGNKERCLELAESITGVLKNKPRTADIPVDTQVLCYLVLNRPEDIMDMGESAFQPLIDAQVVEELNIGGRAASILLKLLRDSDSETSAILRMKLGTTKEIILQARQAKSIEMEETLPSLVPDSQVNENLISKMNKMMAYLGYANEYGKRKHAVEEIVKLAESEKESVTSALVEELRKIREGRKEMLLKDAGNMQNHADFDNMGYSCYHILECLEQIGDSTDIPPLKEIASDKKEEGDIRRKARRAISMIIMRGLDEIEPPTTLNSWFEIYVKPVGEKNVLHLMEEVIATKAAEIGGTANRVIKAIEIISDDETTKESAKSIIKRAESRKSTIL